MQRAYEVMFILRPDMPEEEVDKLISALESNVTTGGGKVKSTEKMGKRRLAYNVRSFREGLYVLFTLEGSGEMIHEIERRLRVSEPVIKFLTVRVDEGQKRLAKVRAIRATRVKRAPAAPVAAPESATPQSAPAAV